MSCSNKNINGSSGGQENADNITTNNLTVLNQSTLNNGTFNQLIGGPTSNIFANSATFNNLFAPLPTGTSLVLAKNETSNAVSTLIMSPTGSTGTANQPGLLLGYNNTTKVGIINSFDASTNPSVLKLNDNGGPVWLSGSGGSALVDQLNSYTPSGFLTLNGEIKFKNQFIQNDTDDIFINANNATNKTIHLQSAATDILTIAPTLITASQPLQLTTLKSNNSGNITNLISSGSTTRTLTLPNKTDTIATLSDITASANYGLIGIWNTAVNYLITQNVVFNNVFYQALENNNAVTPLNFLGLYSGAGPTNSNVGSSGTVELGDRYTTSSNIYITSFSIFVGNGETLSSHTIRVWNGAGTLIYSQNCLFYLNNGYNIFPLTTVQKILSGSTFTISYTPLVKQPQTVVTGPIADTSQITFVNGYENTTTTYPTSLSSVRHFCQFQYTINPWYPIATPPNRQTLGFYVGTGGFSSGTYGICNAFPYQGGVAFVPSNASIAIKANGSGSTFSFKISDSTMTITYFEVTGFTVNGAYQNVSLNIITPLTFSSTADTFVFFARRDTGSNTADLLNGSLYN